MMGRIIGVHNHHNGELVDPKVEQFRAYVPLKSSERHVARNHYNDSKCSLFKLEYVVKRISKRSGFRVRVVIHHFDNKAYFVSYSLSFQEKVICCKVWNIIISIISIISIFFNFLRSFFNKLVDLRIDVYYFNTFVVSEECYVILYRIIYICSSKLHDIISINDFLIKCSIVVINTVKTKGCFRGLYVQYIIHKYTADLVEFGYDSNPDIVSIFLPEPFVPFSVEVRIEQRGASQSEKPNYSANSGLPLLWPLNHRGHSPEQDCTKQRKSDYHCPFALSDRPNVLAQNKNRNDYICFKLAPEHSDLSPHRRLVWFGCIRLSGFAFVVRRCLLRRRSSRSGHPSCDEAWQYQERQQYYQRPPIWPVRDYLRHVRPIERPAEDSGGAKDADHYPENDERRTWHTIKPSPRVVEAPIAYSVGVCQ